MIKVRSFCRFTRMPDAILYSSHSYTNSSGCVLIVVSVVWFLSVCCGLHYSFLIHVPRTVGSQEETKVFMKIFFLFL